MRRFTDGIRGREDCSSAEQSRESPTWKRHTYGQAELGVLALPKELYSSTSIPDASYGRFPGKRGRSSKCDCSLWNEPLGRYCTLFDRSHLYLSGFCVMAERARYPFVVRARSFDTGQNQSMSNSKNCKISWVLTRWIWARDLFARWTRVL